jgi:hypothetical protein
MYACIHTHTHTHTRVYNVYRMCVVFGSVIFLGTLYVTELNIKENERSQDFLQLHSTYAVGIGTISYFASDNFCSCVSSSCLNSVP